MSALSGILDAFEAAAGAAIAGLGVSRQPRQAAGVPADAFPHLAVGLAELRTEPTLYGGLDLTWSIGASLFRQRGEVDYGPDGDRELLAQDLEALVAALVADPTLGGACERAWISEGEILSNLEGGFAELALVLAARLTR